jgi:hypothetical protein
LEYFPQKQKQQRHEQLGYTDKLVTTQIYCRSLKILGPLSNFEIQQSEVAECPAGTKQTEGNLGLVWRNRKKISQIINDYLYLPFFILIILWPDIRISLRDDRPLP